LFTTPNDGSLYLPVVQQLLGCRMHVQLQSLESLNNKNNEIPFANYKLVTVTRHF